VGEEQKSSGESKTVKTEKEDLKKESRVREIKRKTAAKRAILVVCWPTGGEKIKGGADWGKKGGIIKKIREKKLTNSPAFGEETQAPESEKPRSEQQNMERKEGEGREQNEKPREDGGMMKWDVKQVRQIGKTDGQRLLGEKYAPRNPYVVE